MTDTNNTDGAALLPVTATAKEREIANSFGAAWNVNAAMAYGIANLLAQHRHRLASLSTPTAEPTSPCPGDGDGLTDSRETWGQRVTAWIDEFGYDALERELCASRNTLMIWTMGRSMPRPFARQGLIRTINEYRAALTTPPTPDRIGKDAVRERVGILEAALWSVLSYDQLLRQYSGPQAILFAGDVAEIDATYDAMVAKVTAALSATPAQEGGQ